VRLALLVLACGCGVPNAQDAEIARAICGFIRQGHDVFLDSAGASESPGRAIYWRPGVGGDTTIDLYEITTPEEMAEVERLAREALRATPGASSVTLRFYEKQSWRVQPNGFRERQQEKLLSRSTFDRDD
jgi:hypothetical protein